MTEDFEARAADALRPTLRIAMIRSGLEINLAGELQRLRTGDVVELPREHASTIVRNGAADIVKDPTL